MGLFSKLNKSAALMNGMAQRVGVDLSAGMLTSTHQAAPAYRNLVLRCAGCSEQAACEVLQADHDHLDAAPGYCRNADRMNAKD